MEYTKKISRDPFYEAPLHKGYYHPSQKKKLSKKDKKICLSPEKQPSKKESKPLKPADEKFLKGTNVYTGKAPPTGDTPSPATSASSKFNESWPESERASTIGLVPEFNLSPVQDSYQRLHSTKLDMGPITSDSDASRRGGGSHYSSTTSGNKQKNDAESTLQKYINRFRYGQPLSREAREAKKPEKTKDFWWLTSKSPSTPGRSSTPNGDTPSPGKMKTRLVRSPLSPYSPMKPGRSSSSSSGRSGYRPSVPAIDEMTQKLQEKADRLLELSESSLSSEPIVSTLGLGSEPSLESVRSRSSASLVEERPYRPGFIRYMQEKENLLHRDDEVSGPRRDPTVPRRDAPSDDILDQWRLRRKMETARTKGYPSIRLLDAGRGSASPRKADRDPEIESKLADFRSRLAQASSGRYSSPLKPGTNVHFTPSPPRQGEKQVPMSPERDQPEHDMTRPPPQIASPTLKRKPGTKDQVEPHLHLMCDILPCPHQTEAKKCMDEHTERSGGGQGPDVSEHLDKETEGWKHGGTSRENLREGSEDLELDKGNHYKDEVRELSENSSDNDREIGESDEKVSEVDKQMAKVSQCDTLQTCDGSVSFENDVPVRDSGPTGQHGIRPARKGRDTDVNVKDSDKGFVSEKSQKPKRGSRNVPHPKIARDSPKKRDSSVDNVVGEVVTERLFVSPTSSVDSIVSERNRAPDASSEQDTLTSDLDEFAEDELLRQLRKQREKFESKLKLIDQLLEQTKTPK
ncbi:uncharacterized protein LOC135502365 [Lineus longissimus]|uniref:uncharacterized protein LOC135502365 n=1 Tax=Lineus longissimus TaxID=88925 RepID=UPI002B4E76D4